MHAAHPFVAGVGRLRGRGQLGGRRPERAAARRRPAADPVRRKQRNAFRAFFENMPFVGRRASRTASTARCGSARNAELFLLDTRQLPRSAAVRRREPASRAPSAELRPAARSSAPRRRRGCKRALAGVARDLEGARQRADDDGARRAARHAGRRRDRGTATTPSAARCSSRAARDRASRTSCRSSATSTASSPATLTTAGRAPGSPTRAAAPGGDGVRRACRSRHDR